MPFDAVALNAVYRELERVLLQGRIEKAFQPEKDEIHLVVRSNFENYRLLISASSLYPRIHLTQSSKPNPAQAPMFCMLLRKHVVGGRVTALRQMAFDRILEMDVSAFDELGSETHLTLRMEFMGRHSNIILTDSDGRILDSVKRVNEDRSRVREILPGLRYEYPPRSDKLLPTQVSSDALLALFRAAPEVTLDTALFRGVAGLSPATAKDFMCSAGICDARTANGLSEQALSEVCARLMERFAAIDGGNYTPCLLGDPTAPSDFSPFAPSQGAFTAVSGMSEALERFYEARDLHERLRQKCASMTQVLGQALSRAQRKEEKQATQLHDASGLEEYRLMGELLTANLYQLKKGMLSAQLINYYDENAASVTIPLDVRLTPAQNSQAYYKKYAKAKATLEKLQGHYDDTLQEIAYLQGQLLNITNCSCESDVEDIRAELLAQGYLKPQRGAVKKQLPASQPAHYKTTDGMDVLVGRNNVQNDRLTFKIARAGDIWMHTKNIPGSHVILQTGGEEPSPQALREAALLAAYYSQARDSSAVPVDYTQRRNVKKPAGARPGFVIYLTNQTLYVSPDAAAVAALGRED
ncbi:MAG: NFACT RNA binding domain-containing protein [Eubacteriales bacterium]|nr:NFACT RNA binding domain-containing protein [Eubacteriales bacterium]